MSPLFRSLVLLILITGCSKGTVPSAQVAGLVRLEGKPVPAGSVLMIAESGDFATSTLQPSGAFSLDCKPGRYQVAVVAPPGADPYATNVNASIAGTDIVTIPSHYQDVGTSGISIEIQPGSNQFDIDLQLKKAR